MIHSMVAIGKMPLGVTSARHWEGWFGVWLSLFFFEGESMGESGLGCRRGILVVREYALSVRSVAAAIGSSLATVKTDSVSNGPRSSW